MIDWGNGSTTAGTIRPTGNNGFSVDGSQTYALAGTYTVRITITDSNGGSTTVTTTITVADATALDADDSDPTEVPPRLPAEPRTVLVFLDAGDDDASRVLLEAEDWDPEGVLIDPLDAGELLRDGTEWVRRGEQSPGAVLDANGHPAEISPTAEVGDERPGESSVPLPAWVAIADDGTGEEGFGATGFFAPGDGHLLEGGTGGSMPAAVLDELFAGLS
jgi:PKD repeat protein